MLRTCAVSHRRRNLRLSPRPHLSSGQLALTACYNECGGPCTLPSMPLLRLFFVFVAMLAFSVCGDDRPATVLPTRQIHVTSADGTRSEKLIVELATTPADRSQGLMLRQSMPEDAGMLFLFPANGEVGFWMKDTYIPLTIAYLADDGTILETRDGKPLDTKVLTPGGPYRHVLEVNLGWFTRHGFTIGSKVEIPADAPAPK